MLLKAASSNPARLAATNQHHCRKEGGGLHLAIGTLLLAGFFSTGVSAAQLPDAGAILQQVEPATSPPSSSGETGLTIEPEIRKPSPPSISFPVKAIHITGNTLFDAEALHALVADAENKPLTLSELDEIAARITAYYHDHGYPLSRAFVPAQTIQAGVVRLEIIEAHYGNVHLDNRSQVKTPLLESTLSPLKNGETVAQPGMDRSLLLLSDIPGVGVNAILKPGKTAGTSDLVVETTDDQKVTGNLSLDSYGNDYTGKVRAAGSVSFNNPLAHGDVLSANILSSGSGMNYGRTSYESLLNGLGSRMGGSYSSLSYKLGGPLTSLNGHGTAQTMSLWVKHPFLRSRNTNFYGQFQIQREQLRDRIDVAALQTDRHLNSWRINLSGDISSPVAANTWGVNCTSGQVIFDNGSAQLADTTSARTQGRFSKWNVTVARQQYLRPEDSLYFNFAAQGATGNLDSSEKMSVGGPYSVRAYDAGVASGDVGYFLSAEFRHSLGELLSGLGEITALVGAANIKINQSPWTAGTNYATLSGVSLGFNWAGLKQMNLKIYIAAPLGPSPALAGTPSAGRAGAEIGYRL